MEFAANPFSSVKAGTSAKSPALSEMAFIFGVPESIVLASDPNRASARTGQYLYAKNTVQPYLTLIEEKLNEELIPMFGEDAEDNLFLAFENVVPKDVEMELKVVDMLAKNKAITKNELRIYANMEPLPEFDEEPEPEQDEVVEEPQGETVPEEPNETDETQND